MAIYTVIGLRGMKYIKRHLQIVEPTINDEGYYVVGNVAIHPDVFHQQYQPLGFTLTAEEVDIAEVVFNRFILYMPDLRKFIVEHNEEFEIINNIINRIKQYKDENTTD